METPAQNECTDPPSRYHSNGSGTQPEMWDAANADAPPAWVETLPPAARDELSLVVGVYPDAVVYHMDGHISGGPGAPEVASHVPIDCDCDTDDAPVSRPFAPAARLGVPLEGDNVLVTLTVVIMRGHGVMERGCDPVVELRSTNAARTVVEGVAATLRAEVAEHSRDCGGAMSLLAIVARATELVQHIPLGMQSHDFGYCFNCAREAQRKAKLQVARGEVTLGPDGQPAVQRKYPQPLRRIQNAPRDAGNNHEDDDSIAGQAAVLAAVRAATALMNGRAIAADTFECLTCRSTADVVHIASIAQNTAGDPCSYCYFDDNPLIKIPGCGCNCCFTCFSSFTAIATGSNELKRCARTKFVGVACPNHPSSVISEPALFKLCDTASYLRFNRFAMRMTATALNGFECRNPRCCGLPTISNLSGNKFRCGYCNTWSCAACNSGLVECRCPEWPEPTGRDHFVSSNAVLLSRPAQLIPGDRIAARAVRFLVLVGARGVPVTLSSVDPAWEKAMRFQLAEDVVGLSFRIIFHGVPLDANRPIGVFPVYDGAIVYCIKELSLMGSKSLATERDLFDFRRHVEQMRNAKPEAVAEAQDGVYKRCPKCQTPVVHYHNHGCHHIGFNKSCCGHHWCYVCLGPHPCKSCPLMCGDFCKCPPCPECKPMMPCAQCWGCANCRAPGAAANQVEIDDLMA